MRETIEERACQLALYIIENNATVRSTATQFGISKSTVHTVVTKQNVLPNAETLRLSVFYFIKRTIHANLLFCIILGELYETTNYHPQSHRLYHLIFD